MKTLHRLLLSVALLLGAVPAFAQTATTQTTLSTAITATQTSFALASVTGIGAGSQICFADVPDCALVASVSGTTVTVNQRGVDGTGAASHPASVVVFASAAGAPSATTATPFIHGSPTDSPFGNACTRTQQQLLPLYDVDTGTIWDCIRDAITANSANANAPTTPTVGRWRGTSLIPGGIAGFQGTVSRTPVINADYQIKAWDYLVSVTSLTTLGGINLTLPSATGLLGKTLMIKDEGGFVTAGSNLVLTVVGTIDGATNLVISSPYSRVGLVSNGVTWFRIW